MYLAILTEEQRLELNRRAHERGVAPITRDRLEMVRLSDAGWSVPRIAKHLGVYEKGVRRWVKAYLSDGFDALGNKPHLGKQSALSKEMLAGVRAEIGKGNRTFTARQIGDWVFSTYGVSLSERRLRLHLKRAGLTWQRTSRDLKHKQEPDAVAKGQAALQSLEKGGMPS